MIWMVRPLRYGRWRTLLLWAGPGFVWAYSVAATVSGLSIAVAMYHRKMQEMS